MPLNDWHEMVNVPPPATANNDGEGPTTVAPLVVRSGEK
jgi:hypothetical protein